MSNSLASQWQTAAQERAAESAKQEPTAIIKLPGFEEFPFVGRRLPMVEWAQNGMIPQTLADKFIEQQEDETDVEADAGQLSADETKRMLRFRQRVIATVVVDPVIVFEDRPVTGNEVMAAVMPADLLNAIFKWAMALSPGVPVATDEGVTTVAAVESFRPDQLGTAAPDGASVSGEQVWAESVPAHRPPR